MLAHVHMPRRPAILLPLLAALLCCALTAPAAEGKVKFQIRGKGYGHGVGMSQWGAYGMAREGIGHKRILRHYYESTKIGRASGKDVSVLLNVRSDPVSFSGARKACGRTLKPARTYRAAPAKGARKVRLERANGRKLASCGKRLGAKSTGKISIGGEGTYRGQFVAKATGSGLNVINKLPLDSYVKGVVPNEVPGSWPKEALRAQAVAARSYALATGLDGDGFDFYDDTRSQVYGGAASEQRSTNRAVRKTERQIVAYRGKVVPTFFFSSSGGRTENVEFGFSGGSPRPYLKSVRDRYDKASPYHRWKLTLSRKRMERKLGGLVRGKLKRIEVTRTGASPRIVKARVIGTEGKRSASGSELQASLGLRSTWARFKRVKR